MWLFVRRAVERDVRGVIAAGNRETVRVGREILAAGGNAVDAAVAATFVSFLSEIAFVHLGGSGIAQVYHPRRGPQVYDFFSNHPGIGAQRTPSELDFSEVWIDYGGARQSFHLGRGSVAVPGNVFGLCEMARDFGSMPLQRLLEPAIERAREGVVLDRFQAETSALLAPLYTHTEGMRQIFAPRGDIVRPGEKVRIPRLDETLEGIGRQGEEVLRGGDLGRALVEDQRENGGLLTEEDLTHYRVLRDAPICIPYRDRQVLLPGLSSMGGVLTGFAIRLLERFHPGRRKHGSAASLQLLAEVLGAASQARALPENVAEQLSREDTIGRFEEKVRRRLRESTASEAPREPRGPSATSHVSVLDEEGLAVSLTNTAGESAGYVVPGTGFIPNNMLGEADLHPQGFHRGQPGQRIPTMMTPVLVIRDGRVEWVIGTGGSTRIRSATLQVLSNLLDHGMPLPEAVDSPRIHFEAGVLHCEGGIAPASRRRLESMGYRVNSWDGRSIYFGGAHCVGRVGEELVGAGDPRRGGAVEMMNE